ncbi:hypothetical protein BTA51_09405 [Hahella sp. CCB-MM4]|uniref:OTU domain-containing protein n=1 Tax=Hahella sp. (strain CCB-MM4) TaxID=1926491 RepID=UPI000B9AFD9D|nr:OTU domain-containing protein [Hahella sp. CCB-MM4]OZG73986.1 hypothetical protein BTA51_09405 [Hahella sp. CCB-MM4]
MFKSDYKGQGRRYLGPIRDWIKIVRSNYDFASGDIEAIKKHLPLYRQELLKMLEELKAKCSGVNDAPLDPVKAALEKALFVDMNSTSQSSGYSIPPSFSSSVSTSNSLGIQPSNVQVTENGHVLHANDTAGGGDCFYHSIFEALNGRSSNLQDQQSVRARIVTALRHNPRLAASHFGSDRAGSTALERFIQEVSRQTEWVPDHGPAIIADALGIRIVIHRPNGTVYYDARPNATIVGPPSQTIHLQYTGAHYNSYTRNQL